MSTLIEEVEPLRRILARLALPMSTWERAAADMTPPPDELAVASSEGERVIFELLIAPRPVAIQKVTAVLGLGCTHTLQSLGILRHQGQDLDSCGLRLRFVAGLALLTGDRGEPRRNVHFGHDTLCLLGAAEALPPAGHALELCCGGAGSAIALGRTHATVTATDLLQEVTSVAAVNVALNGRANVEVLTGDLWAPVGGRSFDTIVANPPFVPCLGDPADDPAGTAGADGLAVARAIWTNADQYLSPVGVLIILVAILGSRTEIPAQAELDRLGRGKGWRVEIIGLRAPKAIEHLTIPQLQQEPAEPRLRSLREQAASLAATHFHLVLLRFCAHSKPGVVHYPAYPGTHSQLLNRMRELRRQRTAS